MYIRKAFTISNKKENVIDISPIIHIYYVFLFVLIYGSSRVSHLSFVSPYLPRVVRHFLKGLVRCESLTVGVPVNRRVFNQVGGWVGRVRVTGNFYRPVEQWP